MTPEEIIYTGIGPRALPTKRSLGFDLEERTLKTAYALAKKGWVLRSGAANGMDSLFEQGCDAAKGEKDIFLPWPKFNRYISDGNTYENPSQKAQDLVKNFADSSNMSNAVRLLFARNIHQVAGWELDDPSDCLLYWNPPNKTTGGTAFTLKVAQHFSVPTYNLSSLIKLENFKTDFNLS